MIVMGKKDDLVALERPDIIDIIDTAVLILDKHDIERSAPLELEVKGSFPEKHRITISLDDSFEAELFVRVSIDDKSVFIGRIFTDAPPGSDYTALSMPKEKANLLLFLIKKAKEGNYELRGESAVISEINQTCRPLESSLVTSFYRDIKPKLPPTTKEENYHGKEYGNFLVVYGYNQLGELTSLMAYKDKKCFFSMSDKENYFVGYQPNAFNFASKPIKLPNGDKYDPKTYKEALRDIQTLNALIKEGVKQLR